MQSPTTTTNSRTSRRARVACRDHLCEKKTLSRRSWITWKVVKSKGVGAEVEEEDEEEEGSQRGGSTCVT